MRQKRDRAIVLPMPINEFNPDMYAAAIEMAELGAIRYSWGEFVDDVEEAVEEGAKEVKEAATELKEDLEDNWEDFTGDAEDTWNDATDDVKSAWDEHGFLGAVVAIFGAGIAVTVGIVGNVADFGANVVGSVAKAFFTMAGAILGLIARLLVGVFTGGPNSSAAIKAGRLFSDGGKELGDKIADAASVVGQLAERATDIVVDLTLSLVHVILCSMNDSVLASSGSTGLDAIDHFFVLMLENRSFDHMLGSMPGVDGYAGRNYFNNASDGAPCAVGSQAPFMLKVDCPHEFPDVDWQLYGDPGMPNGGFVTRYEKKMRDENQPTADRTAPVRTFNAATLPIMYTLATEFAVCDRWFSSLPGPTLPNRQFVHAATSGGMADSPNNIALGAAMPIGGFEFENGTVYDRLDAKCIPWKIYAGDYTPLVMSLRAIASDDAMNGWTQVDRIDDLLSALPGADSSFPNYVFIEPNYGRFWSDYHGGNSQHPTDSTAGGEALIKSIYETLRSSPIWTRSALIVVYDEHGGFYDHVEPPAAVPPGDARRYDTWSESEQARRFQFDRYGIRVPVIVISPWVEKGTIDSTPYDHSSVIATISKRFRLKPLTKRDAAANTFSGVFSRSSPRNDAPVALPGTAGPLS